jgi:hypothetical protein
MSVIRDHGELTFECDSCGDLLDTGMTDFADALANAKREGWVVVRKATRVEIEWQHRCPECEDEE